MGETTNTLQQRNDAQRRDIVAQVEEIKVLKKKLAQAEIFERFIGHLIDNCEGQTVTEENLQGWMHSMLEQEKNGKVTN